MESGPSLDAKLMCLARPETYPEAPSRVETVETHLSWVFLTDTHAYKLKKSVCYAGVDFRPLDARHENCVREVALNRRLAPGVYLGAVPLVRTAAGSLQLDGQGEVVDWLVKMRRLPAARMLDQLIGGKRVSRSEIEALATRLVAFYAKAVPEPLTPDDYRNILAARIDAHLDALAARRFAVDLKRLAQLRALQHAYLAEHAAEIDARVTARRVVEGHGDLRPEHVCLLDEPLVIDCLEFRRDLRIVDPADELGYLALECERLGAAYIGLWLFTAYTLASGDAPESALVHFYQAMRAVLRAKLAYEHLHDGDRGGSTRWRATGADYLGWAQRHARLALDSRL